MSRIVAAMLFAVAVWSVSRSVNADWLEYDRSDLYPKFMKIDFSKSAIYFSGHMLRSKLDLWYSLDRHTSTLEQLATSPEVMPQPGLVMTPGAVNGSLDGADIDAAVVTGKNISFDMHIPYCGEGDEGDGELDFEGKKLPVPLNHCDGPGAVEQYGKYLLVGSRYSGEGGQSADLPVIVLDAKTYRFIKDIPFAASVIRADPYADQVWMAGVDGIELLDKDLNVRKRWYFYIGFDPVNYRPSLLLSEEPMEDEPMADLARTIGVKDFNGWYKAVQGIPGRQRGNFSLYDLHMDGYQKLPDTFNVLFPYFKQVIEGPADDGEKGYAVKTMCGLSDPGKKRFLDKLAHDPSIDASLLGIVTMCQKGRLNAFQWRNTAGAYH